MLYQLSYTRNDGGAVGRRGSEAVAPRASGRP
jgi:hypothetical protein